VTNRILAQSYNHLFIKEMVSVLANNMSLAWEMRICSSVMLSRLT